MESLIKALTVAVLLTGTLAQYEGYGYEEAPQSLGHDFREDMDVDYHAHPKYTYDYAVKDPHTGDNKEHWETRDGDKVKGSYTIYETDGTKRVVEYEADDKNGFNAVVHKIGTPIRQYDYPNVQQEEREKESYDNLRYSQYSSLDDGGFIPIVPKYQH